MTSAISVAGLTRRYRDQVALDDMSVEIEAGSITGLLGRNGAGKTTLMRLVARQAAIPVAGGIVAGLILAFAATRYVQSLLYETSAADPAAITISIALLAIAALLAALIPARRAAQTDPMAVLRNE